MGARVAHGPGDWDPKYLGMALVALTVAGLGFSDAGRIGLARAPKLWITGSGRGNPRIAGIASPDIRTGVTPPRVALWTTLLEDPAPDDDEIPRRTVRVVDDRGKPWPHRLSFGEDGFTVMIPEGYGDCRPRLYVEVSTPGKAVARTQLPELPKLPRGPALRVDAAWPNTDLDFVQTPTDRRSKLGLRVSSPVGNGHVLVGAQIGSSATMHESLASETSVAEAAIGASGTRASVTVPIRLSYPLTTEAAYVRVRELAPVRVRETVRLKGYSPTFKFGEWWLPPEYRRLRTKDGTQFLLMTTDRPVFRRPTRMRSAIQLYLNPVGQVRLEKVHVLGPTHLGGVPLRVAWPKVWSAAPRREFHPGDEFAFELEYVRYKLVREGTFRAPVSPDLRMAASQNENFVAAR